MKPWASKCLDLCAEQDPVRLIHNHKTRNDCVEGFDAVRVNELGCKTVDIVQHETVVQFKVPTEASIQT
jgi:hypothetical protein